ncbi:hypothetical protein DPSP01_009051 [Paraphaeosphaeria sporulosa]
MDPLQSVARDVYRPVDVGAVPGQRFIDHSKYASFGKMIEADGWSPLIEAAWNDECETRSQKIQDLGLATFERTADDLFCAMHSEVLKPICSGNFAQAYDKSKADGGELHNGLQARAYRARLKALGEQDKKFRDGIMGFDAV